MYPSRPFRGFPWWLPPAAALIAALLTFLIVGSAEAVWAAESRVWIRDDRLAMKDVESLFMDPMVLETTLQWSGSEMSAAELTDAVELVRNQRLFMIRVVADSPGEAEELADVLATVVVEECQMRNPGPSHAEALGTSWPGARQIAPRTAGKASLAGLGGLLGGIALAAALTRRAQPQPPSPLALLGRRGWRPLAVLGERDPNGAGEPPPSAAQLADALLAVHTTARSAARNAAQNAAPGEVSASSVSGRATTAFAPLHDDADAGLAALQAARALAGRNLAVLWLDARPLRPVLLALPNDSRNPPAPLQPPDPEGAPRWLQGAPLPSQGERIRRLIAANAQRFDAIILVVDSIAADPRSREAASAADRVVLAARDDFDPSGPEAAHTAAALRGTAPVLGLALTHASDRRAKDFESARESAREERN